MDPIQIGVCRETLPGETRVALTPDVIKNLIKSGFLVVVEKGAGEKAHFSDNAYQSAGAQLAPDRKTLFSDSRILVAVNAPPVEDIRNMKAGNILLCFQYAHTRPDLVQACLQAKITSFAIDAVPRISRAQKMDALSSQANLAGYQCVILGAAAMSRIFPLLMTAAGTITPARVLIFGAGVAGLQAIATAKRLGAIVEVTDVRPETKEEVESLGGKFLQVEGAPVKIEGGYAKEVSAEFLQKQKELVQKSIREADLVITTAQVMGKKAPVLISEEMVGSMKPGSVIVDLAAAQGGNCALTEAGKHVQKHGVTIIGETNVPGLLPFNASELYARNIQAFLLHLCNKDGINLDFSEEITGGSCIVHQGEILHQLTREMTGQAVSQ